MHTIAPFIVSAVAWLPFQAPSASNPDRAVYQAILADQSLASKTLRGTGVVLDQIAPCMRDLGLDCLPDEERRFFPGLLTPASREQLRRSFRDRARGRQPFPRAALDGLIAVAREAPYAPGTGRGSFSRLSLPAYSTDGHALVYGEVHCGSLCGFGWLFLLERQGTAWRVVSVQGLWVS